MMISDGRTDVPCRPCASAAARCTNASLALQHICCLVAKLGQRRCTLRLGALHLRGDGFAGAIKLFFSDIFGKK